MTTRKAIDEIFNDLKDVKKEVRQNMTSLSKVHTPRSKLEKH